MKRILLIGFILLLSGCSSMAVEPKIQEGIKTDQKTTQKNTDLIVEKIEEEKVKETTYVTPAVTKKIKPPSAPIQQTETTNNIIEEVTQDIIHQEIKPLILPSTENKYCCKYCKKGKACGDSCISRNYTCHKGAGCACDS